jgi:hypothetical protein
VTSKRLNYLSHGTVRMWRNIIHGRYCKMDASAMYVITYRRTHYLPTTRLLSFSVTQCSVAETLKGTTEQHYEYEIKIYSYNSIS